MKSSIKEKYFGDIINQHASIQATIDSRKKAFGRHKSEVAMKLREAMLLNRILFHIEAWHGITLKQIKSLETID